MTTVFLRSNRLGYKDLKYIKPNMQQEQLIYDHTHPNTTGLADVIIIIIIVLLYNYNSKLYSYHTFFKTFFYIYKW